MKWASIKLMEAGLRRKNNMKAFFVVISNDDCHSGVFEVKGKTVKECVENGIVEFDSECITGDGLTKEEWIEVAAENYVRESPAYISKTLVPSIRNYFLNNYVQTALIYNDKKGELKKVNADPYIEKHFEGIEDDVKRQVDKLEKAKRKKQFDKLKKEFGK